MFTSKTEKKQTYKFIKRLAKKYKDNLNLIAEYNLAKKYLEEIQDPTNLKAMAFDTERVDTSPTNSSDNILISYMDKTEFIEKELLRLEYENDLIKLSIKNLDNKEHEEIFKSRYFDNREVDYILGEFNLSKQSYYNMLDSIVNEISNNFNKMGLVLTDTNNLIKKWDLSILS